MTSELEKITWHVISVIYLPRVKKKSFWVHHRHTVRASTNHRFQYEYLNTGNWINIIYQMIFECHVLEMHFLYTNIYSMLWYNIWLISHANRKLFFLVTTFPNKFISLYKHNNSSVLNFNEYDGRINIMIFDHPASSNYHYLNIWI